MATTQSPLTQRVFILIRQLHRNRASYKFLQTIIALIDYLIIISLTFCTSLQLSLPQNLLQYVLGNVISLDEFFTILVDLECVIIAIFLISALIQILSCSRGSMQQDIHRIIGFNWRITVITSWIFQATLIFFYFVLTQRYSLQESFFSISSIAVISIISSVFYVFLFQNRKIYSVWLPVIFLSRIFLSAKASIVTIILISVYCFRQCQGKIKKIIYIEVILLEIVQFSRIQSHNALSSNNILISCFILILIPVIQHCRNFQMIYKQEVILNDDESIFRISKKMKENSYQQLQTSEKIMLWSFQFLQQQKGSNQQPIGKQTKQTIFQLLNQKLRSDFKANPKEISKIITRIKLNCLENVNILAIFKMLQELNSQAHSQSLYKRYIIYSFVSEIIQALNLQNLLDLNEIRESDFIQKNNDREVLIFLRSLIDFWQYFEGETLREQIILQKLENLHKNEMTIKRHIQYYKKHPSLRKNLLVLQFSQKCLYPHLQIASAGPDEEINQFVKYNQQKEIITYFLTIQNNKISVMSYNLCKRLGYGNSMVNQLFKSDIFPKYVLNIEEYAVREGEKNKVFILPLINCQGNIQIFKARIHLVPNFEGHLTFFLQLEQLSQEQFPYVIINATHESIDYVSNNFCKYFKHFKVREEINLEELFCYNFNNFRQSHLNQCTIEMKIVRQQRKIVKLVKLCSYFFDECDFFLIRLEVNKNIISNNVLSLFIQKSINENAENRWWKYQNENFFCKIPHPFENKYNQHILRLNDSTRWTTSEKLNRLFFALIFLFLFNLIFVDVIISTNSTSYLNKISQLNNVNQARSKLASLYEKCYQLYYMRQSNATFTSIYYQNTTIIDKYTVSINELVDDLQKFRYSYHNEIVDLPLIIQFKNFNVDANTGGINLIDIVESGKQFLRDNDLTFLVNNFGLISSFEQAYEIYPLLQSEISCQNQIILYGTFSSLAAMCFVLFFIYSNIKISIDHGKHIIKLIMNSKKMIVMNTLKLLRHFEHYLIENKELYFLKEESANKLKEINQIVNLIEEEKKFEDQIKNEMRQINQFEDKLITNLATNNQSQQVRQNKELLYTLYSKKTTITAPSFAYFRQSYFLVIFAFIAIYFLRIYDASLSYSQSKIVVLGYFNQFFYSSRNVRGLSAQMYQIAMQNQYQKIYDNNALSISLQSHFEQDLPGYFQQFTKTQSKIINRNLCQESREFSFNSSYCNQIGGGALTNGLGVAFGLYFQLVFSVIHSKSSIADERMTSKDGLQKLSEILLMEQLMISNIELSCNKFMQTAIDYIHASDRQLFLSNAGQQCLLLIVIILIFLVGIKRYKKRCNLLVKGFTILPKDYILNKKLLKYFAKYKIFENIVKI